MGSKFAIPFKLSHLPGRLSSESKTLFLHKINECLKLMKYRTLVFKRSSLIGHLVFHNSSNLFHLKHSLTIVGQYGGVVSGIASLGIEWFDGIAIILILRGP